ncbi:MAG: OmpH family outer membrane protein [Dysgonamonadaceae bacterium]|jgi:outer membrane protein|nr:OmpH family outer membrane protein [Dysgonamonadaceae bacterium]
MTVKKLVLFAFLLVPALGFSQEKIAYVSYEEIIPLMPEYEALQDSLENENANYAEQLKTDQDEYEKKYAEFVEKQATLAENIKKRRQEDLEDLRKRIFLFQQQAQQSLQTLQQTLLAPIIAKVDKALEDISVQNGFTYVIRAEALQYSSPKSINATPLLKAKLGLKDAPAAK